MYQKDVDDAAAYLMLHVPSPFLPSPYSVAAANERENNARNVEQKHSSQRSVMDRGVAAVLSRLQVAMLPVAMLQRGPRGSSPWSVCLPHPHHPHGGD